MLDIAKNDIEHSIIKNELLYLEIIENTALWK